MNIKELKAVGQKIKEIDKVIVNFEKNSALLDRHLIKSLKDKEISELFLKVKLLHAQIIERQIVSERIMSLIHHIGKLRGAVVVKDKKNGKKIVDKFLYDENMQISRMIRENRQLLGEIGELEKLYAIMVKKILKIKKNADFVAKLDEYNHKLFLKELREIHSMQRDLIVNAGYHFIQNARKVLK